MTRNLIETGNLLEQSRLRYSFYTLLTSPEVSRLLEDITTCRITREDRVSVTEQAESLSGGLELFPYHSMFRSGQRIQVTGRLFPNLEDPEHGTLSHLVKLQLGDDIHFLRLSTTQSTYLLSPFHCRFISVLFSISLNYSLAVETGTSRDEFLSIAPYSLEEQAVARYLQSLHWMPCATVKLDAQDNPYIGSRLYTGADLKRCHPPGSASDESIIRGWRLFKRLLYLSIEGERIYTGFAFLSDNRPLSYHKAHWPYLLCYSEADHIPLHAGVQAIKQLLLNADGRSTFLAIYKDRIIGVLYLPEGTQKQLISANSWRESLPLATITQRGRFFFWVTLKGRKSPRIPLSFLEFRNGHIQIPLFQEIFWQELERQLHAVCPECGFPDAVGLMKSLLRALQVSGRGGIFLVGLAASRLQEPYIPIENEVRLAQPAPVRQRWIPILSGLTKSDGAMIFNEHMEATHFRARLKATGLQLPPLERDELGSGTRHQATREFSAYCPEVLGICVSQDGPISLYRGGILRSRLY
jgi:hypothetical protein